MKIIAVATLIMTTAICQANPVQTITGKGNSGAQNYGNNDSAAAQSQGQQQGQSQGQGQTANGGAGGSGGMGGAGGSAVGGMGGNATGGSATGNSSTDNVGQQSINENVERSAPSVGLGAIVITGCGASATGGGSTVHGAAVLGFAWTTDECDAYMLAQGYIAVGQRESACQVLNTTDAARRAVKRGMKLPLCVEPIFVQVKYIDRPVEPQGPTYTRKQVDEIVRKAVSK